MDMLWTRKASVSLLKVKVFSLSKIRINYLNYELYLGIWCETLEDGWAHTIL